MGFPLGWTDCALGNAVVPQIIPEWIGRRLIEMIELKQAA